MMSRTSLWFLLMFLLAIAPSFVFALPADLAYIKTLPVEHVKKHRASFSFDEKGVDQMMMRHKALSNSQGDVVGNSVFDIKVGARSRYMAAHHWTRFKSWTPDHAFVSSSMNAPEYFLGRRVVAALGSPLGMFLSSTLLFFAIYLALMERILPALLATFFYLLWSGMPLLRLFTAWWA